MNRMIALTGWLSESIAVAILSIGILFVGFSQSSFAGIIKDPCHRDVNTDTCVGLCPVTLTCKQTPVPLKCDCLP